MGLHGGLGDREPGGDLGVGGASGRQRQDLAVNFESRSRISRVKRWPARSRSKVGSRASCVARAPVAEAEADRPPNASAEVIPTAATAASDT